MLYKNAYIYTPDHRFVYGAFRVEGDKFTEVLATVPQEDGVDLQGATVIPGLIDVHTHGNSNHDLSDGDPEGIAAMAAYSARHGITSFAPASMTLPYEVLGKAFAAARNYADHRPEDSARLLGVHMEDP